MEDESNEYEYKCKKLSENKLGLKVTFKKTVIYKLGGGGSHL